MSFPVLASRVKDSDLLVFFDFEATQFSHLPIALGVYALPKKKGSLFPVGEKPITYHTLIRTKDTIGKVVIAMTGITKKDLMDSGIPFSQAMMEFEEMVHSYSHKTFLSYGSMDITILMKGARNSDNATQDFAYSLRKHYFDFHDYLGGILCTDKGETYSLTKLLDFFGLPDEGKDHDPLNDSKNLCRIYAAYLKDEEKILAHFARYYAVNPQTAPISREVVLKLLATKTVKEKDFREILRRHL
jgi:inhibitor of KinA sporulation pathway (predicted exonuclease)